MAREAEPWFDPDGFRVLEVDGRIAGSCWTKVHRTTEPHLGEIYVIGVDPEYHGRGWGRALTEDGFDVAGVRGADRGHAVRRLRQRGGRWPCTRSMGMTTHHLDRAYVTSRADAGVPSDRSPV